MDELGACAGCGMCLVEIILIVRHDALLGCGDEQIFQGKLELLDLTLDPLGGFAEGLLLEPGDPHSERLHHQIMGAQRRCQLCVFGLQLGDHRLEAGWVI